MGRGSLDFDNVPPHEVHAVRTLSDPTYGMLVTIPYREPEGKKRRRVSLGAVIVRCHFALLGSRDNGTSQALGAGAVLRPPNPCSRGWPAHLGERCGTHFLPEPLSQGINCGRVAVYPIQLLWWRGRKPTAPLQRGGVRFAHFEATGNWKAKGEIK